MHLKKISVKSEYIWPRSVEDDMFVFTFSFISWTDGRNETARLFPFGLLWLKIPFDGRQKSHTLYMRHLIWSDLHLHGIITQVSYELRNDSFDGPSPEASAHNHMEIVRHEKWKTDKNWHIHCRYRRVQRGLYQTCGELSSSQRSSIVPPHGHLFFSYSEKACKGLQEINSSPKN